MKIVQFLQYVKKVLQSNLKDFHKIHVILGNEASDLDSAVSAIAYGYYLHQTKAYTDIIHVPMLNIRAKDYRLRTEVTHHLGNYELKPDLLTFNDQLDLHELHRTNRLELTLVDHNVLRGADLSLDGAVTCVIDHHKLEREPRQGVEMQVETVGSCATLIADRLLSSAIFEMDTQLAQFLLGPILVDTVCLAPEAGRTSAKDLEVVSKLEKLGDPSKRQELFNQLQIAKADVSALTTTDVLYKDMKSIETTKNNLQLRISSIPLSMTDFLRRDGISADLEFFLRAEKAAVSVLMTLSQTDEGRIRRQIAVYSLDEEIRNQVCQVLEECKSPPLGLKPFFPLEGNASNGVCFNSVACERLQAYVQTTITASRKQILPYLLLTL